MTETSCYLGNHPKSHLQCWSKQLWPRPRVTDRPFSEAGRFYKPSYPILARFASLFFFFLYLACPVQTPCILSVVKTRAIPWPKASFAKKKTCSKPSVFSAQHSLRNRSVLQGVINRGSHQQNPKLFKCHVLQFLEVFEDYSSMQNTVSMYLMNPISLTISMTNVDNYWPIIHSTYIT